MPEMQCLFDFCACINKWNTYSVLCIYKICAQKFQKINKKENEEVGKGLQTKEEEKNFLFIFYIPLYIYTRKEAEKKTNNTTSCIMPLCLLRIIIYTYI